jgi:AraC-like DNA-binding protein
MLAPPVTFGPMLFSSAQLPERERFASWDRLLNKWLLSVDTRPATEQPFPVSVQLRVLPKARFGWGAIGASFNRRTRDEVANDNNDLMLFMNLGGTFQASQNGHEIGLRPGDAYLMACSERGTYDRPTNGSLLCVRLGQDLLAPQVRNLYDRTGRVIPAETDALRLLAGHVQMLTGQEPFRTPETCDVVTRHLSDLLALSLGATGDAAEMARAGGAQAARLKAIQIYVERHAANPQLSSDTVAAKFRLSPRSLQRLFEDTGTTFSEFLRDARLTRAYAALGGAEMPGRSISDIALACGFGDISYFNRSFRARYGIAPSDIRKRPAFG